MKERTLIGLCLAGFLIFLASIARAFILIDDTHDQTVGGTKTHVFPDIGQVTFAVMDPRDPADGEMQYCTDCIPNTSPCTGGGSGAMALRINNAWYCIPNVAAVVATPTPLAFGTPGVIPVFDPVELGSYAGTVACPTPQAISQIDKFGAATCTAFGSACPGGSNTEIQYNSSGACAGSAKWVFNVGTPSVILSDTASGTVPVLQISQSSDTSGAGVGLWLRGSGTNQNSDLLISFDRGVSTGGVDRYLNIGNSQVDGTFRIIGNSTPNDVHTGTPFMEINRTTGNNRILFSPGDGTTTSVSIGFVNAQTTGWSYTSVGGGDAQINTIAANQQITYHQASIGGAFRLGINGSTILVPETEVLDSVGTAEWAVDKTLTKASSNNNPQTICPNNTNVVDGQLVKIINMSNNDLQIAESNTATCKVHTTGAATQTLANQYDNIEFINMDGFWIQSGAVQGP